jgi:hypothetical protein
LRFLFNAMSQKASPDLPLKGIPRMLYADNGIVAIAASDRAVVGIAVAFSLNVGPGPWRSSKLTHQRSPELTH